MQINELRIGNYVLKKGGLIKCDSDFLRDLFYCGGEGNLSGVELTEKILIKCCGFNKSVRPNHTDLYKDLTARMILWFNEGNVAEMDLIQDGKNISFKHSHVLYLHQLQNLHFALTNTEIEINNITKVLDKLVGFKN